MGIIHRTPSAWAATFGGFTPILPRARSRRVHEPAEFAMYGERGAVWKGMYLRHFTAVLHGSNVLAA